MQLWKSYHYKNLTFLALSILFALFISRFEQFHLFLLSLGDWGYLSAFIAGALFVSTFTVSTGIVILLVLAEKLSLLEISVLAGLGAVIGDLIIFKLVKDTLIEEVRPIYERFGGKHITRVLHTRYFSWTVPVLGAILIASPLPDEIGVSMMGIARMKTYQFLCVSFLLNTIGIALVVSASTFIKP